MKKLNPRNKEWWTKEKRKEFSDKAKRLGFGKWMSTKIAEKNNRWSGSKISYTSIHGWLRNRYGNATECENPKCKGKGKRFDWAKIHGRKYTRNINDYKMLCKSCHYHYDRD